MTITLPQGAMRALSIALSLLFTLFYPAASQAEAGRTITWTGCGISKLGFMQDLAAAYEAKTGVHIELSGGGATKGLRSVANGSSDLGGSCRLPLVVKLPDGGYQVESSEATLKMIPIGWDALVVVVNKGNQLVGNITSDQVRRIYTGEITHWSQLGAASDAPINLYVRTGTISGVGRTLRQQMFDNHDQPFTDRATVLPSSGKIEAAIESDPNGLAITGISSARHREGLRIVNLDGVEPNLETLKRGEYKLYRLLFMAVPVNYREDADIAAFVDFALSREGREVIHSTGTLSFRYGLGLFSKMSNSYLNNVDLIEQSGIYSPLGQ